MIFFKESIRMSGKGEYSAREQLKQIRNSIQKVLIPYFSGLFEVENGVFFVENSKLSELLRVLSENHPKIGKKANISIHKASLDITRCNNMLFLMHISPMFSDMYEKLKDKADKLHEIQRDIVNKWVANYERIENDLNTYGIKDTGSAKGVFILKGLLQDIIFRLNYMVEILDNLDKSLSSYHKVVNKMSKVWESATDYR